MPLWYVPAWLVAQLPTLTAVAVASGAVAYVVALLHQPTRIQALTLSPLLIQGVALPAVVVLAGTFLYDGIRHLLFMLPGLVMLAAFGAWMADRYLAGRASGGAHRVRPYLTGAGAVVIVAASLFADVRWMPYEYAFVNPIAAGGDSRRWEVDYWGLTSREGIRRLNEEGLRSVMILPSPSSGLPFGALSGDAASVVPPGQPYGYFTFLRWDPTLPGDCTELFTIRRDGLALGQGYRCVN